MMASALRPEARHQLTDAGRPLRGPNFAAIAPKGFDCQGLPNFLKDSIFFQKIQFSKDSISRIH